MATSSPSNVQLLWQRIDRALARFAPAIGGALRRPLQDEALLRWLHEVAADVPGIVESYAVHDGSMLAGGIFGHLPCSAAAPFPRAARWLAASWAREAHTLVQSIGIAMFPLGAVGTRRRVPLSEIETEDRESLQGILVEPKSGALFALDYSEVGPEMQLVPLDMTWLAYLQALAMDLESGRFECFRDDHQVLRIVEKSASARQVRTPRDDAAVLLEMMCERQLIELADPPHDGLRAQVAKALRKRSADTRLAALRQVFDDSEAVVEDFTSDEELAALIAIVRGD